MTVTARSLSLVLFLIGALACGSAEESADRKEASPPSVSAAAPPPPPARRTLPNAESVEHGTASLERLERVDLVAGLATGQFSIEANDGRAQQGVGALVDGDPETMAITDQVNPLALTLLLDPPIRLRSARILPIGSTYDWVLEPVPGERRHRREDVPEREWSQIDLDEAVETSVVRIELLRLERDDYVHLAEIELYAAPTS